MPGPGAFLDRFDRRLDEILVHRDLEPDLAQEIARFLKKRPEDVPLPHVRPLVAGVPLKAIAEAAEDER